MSGHFGGTKPWADYRRDFTRLDFAQMLSCGAMQSCEDCARWKTTASKLRTPLSNV